MMALNADYLEAMLFVEKQLEGTVSTLQTVRMRSYLPDSSALITARRGLSDLRAAIESVKQRIADDEAVQIINRELGVETGSSSHPTTALHEEDASDEEEEIELEAHLDELLETLSYGLATEEKAMENALANRIKETEDSVGEWAVQAAANAPPEDLTTGTPLTGVAAWAASQETQRRLEREIEQLNREEQTLKQKEQQKRKDVEVLLSDIASLELVLQDLQFDHEERLQRMETMRRDAHGQLDEEYNRSLEVLRQEVRVYQDQYDAEMERIAQLEVDLAAEYDRERERLGIAELEAEKAVKEEELRRLTHPHS